MAVSVFVFMGGGGPPAGQQCTGAFPADMDSCHLFGIFAIGEKNIKNGFAFLVENRAEGRRRRRRVGRYDTFHLKTMKNIVKCIKSIEKHW